MTAESVVSSVAGKISNLLIEEASLLAGVEDEVEWLRAKLGWMKPFLKDAYTKRRRGDERAKHWERDVRDIAYQVEDVIDSYTTEIIRGLQQPVRCCAILEPVERYFRELKPRHKLGADIKQLKVKIQHIDENRREFGLVDLGQSPPDSTVDTDLQRRRRISPRCGDSVVVGFQDHKRKILEELVDTTPTQRCVKSIVGMGGLGKTTLAKMVFNTDEITQSFSPQAWVSVSQEYTLIQLLKDIAKEVTGSVSEGLDESALQKMIYQHLQGKRYFIVLDDVWTTEVWHLIKEALPNDSNSSRVLLTTRSIEVAKYADRSINPYQLPCLDENERLELFLRTAFPTTHDTMPKCPRGLKHIARRLVNKCEGLPLAILVLGGLMSNLNPMKWGKADDGIDWASTEDGQQCLKILALSYDDFPNANMRSCFLYMGVFPKDSIIQASQLINLWVAEGFIPQLPNHTMEDTAEDYLEQLVQRSMIEVVKRDCNGSIRACRIHDLLRELCLREAKEDGFLDVCRSSTDLGRMGREHNPVRLAFHYLNKVEGRCPSSDLRSLLIYNASEVSREIFPGWTKKLRVMHLEYVNCDGLKSLQAEIKAADHLRYFVLRNSKAAFQLPPSFGDIFANLQTLDLTRVDMRQQQLPESLGKMKTLRHLYRLLPCKLPANIANLTNLQTLDAVDADGGWVEQSLATLLNIRTLVIHNLENTQQSDFANALRKLEHLSDLRIKESSTVSAEYIRALSNHNRLFKLYLDGAMPQGQLPESHEFPQNLTVLYLEGSKLEKDPMATLEQLPNLVCLTLSQDSYIQKEMTCTAGGFLRLEELNICSLDQLERWEVEDGAMPNLASLHLSRCHKLVRLPDGLPNLKKNTGIRNFDYVSKFQKQASGRRGGGLVED